MANIYKPEEKYQLECKKLESEIKSLNKPFLAQPGAWITIITLIISFSFNLTQCSVSKLDEKQTQIQISQNKLDIAHLEARRDSLNKLSDSLMILKNHLVTIGDSLDVVNKSYTDRIASATAEFDNLTQIIASMRDKIQATLQTGNTPEATKVTLGKVNESLAVLHNASLYGIGNLENKNAHFKVSATKNAALASQKETEGYTLIKEGQYKKAATAFTESENAYNGYHNSFEIARLLNQQQDKMVDGNVRKKVYNTILTKYATNAPQDVVTYLKEQAK